MGKHANCLQLLTGLSSMQLLHLFFQCFAAVQVPESHVQVVDGPELQVMEDASRGPNALHCFGSNLQHTGLC